MRNFKSWPRIKRAFAAVTFRMTGHSVERAGKLLTRPVALAHLTMKEPYLERTKHLITLSGSSAARCCITSHALYKLIIPFQWSQYFLLFLVAEVSQPCSSPFGITITTRMSLLSLLKVQRNEWHVLTSFGLHINRIQKYSLTTSSKRCWGCICLCSLVQMLFFSLINFYLFFKWWRINTVGLYAYTVTSVLSVKVFCVRLDFFSFFSVGIIIPPDIPQPGCQGNHLLSC